MEAKSRNKQYMTEGLVLGKFMPLHKGHLALIEFALQRCDLLRVLICAAQPEPIDGNIRFNWLSEIFADNTKVDIVLYQYNQNDLPNTSVSSLEVSAKWAMVIKEMFADIDIIFSSEKYGDFLAGILNARHECFDENRIINKISSTHIRNNPFHFWEYLPYNVQPYFVKKIALVGSESTGKSTLAKRLAEHFQTEYVPEVARNIIEHTKDCKIEQLIEIAASHAKAILLKQKSANKILMSDTELLITRSYAAFLFNQKLCAENWIVEANQFDLYIFLENDCPFIQDGTRLNEKERDALNDHHKVFFEANNIKMVFIGGDWENRFNTSVKTINELFFHD
jgi:HTH-type transcriptional repressor of NAD biosynthesis genes